MAAVIPRRLRLHNFLSYRECSIDLEGLRLAVLSGRNGDGKSALLDAMTWSLWGEARGQSEDDRIRHSQQEMLIEFEFDGFPWERRDLLWEQSPLSHAHKIQTPLRILHAELDWRVLRPALLMMGVYEETLKKLENIDWSVRRTVRISRIEKAVIAVRWIVGYSRQRREKTMAERLANEILDASNGIGASAKRREDLHKMADSNKAFAHYRW